MFKFALLGLSATTNLILIGCGGALTGALALRGVQHITKKKAQEIVDDMTRPPVRPAGA